MAQMFTRFNKHQRVGVILWENDDGEEIETSFRIKFVACDHCHGTGSHCDPAIDGNGLTREDFEEDPSFAESYFEGMYDVQCDECNGERVVPEIADEDHLTDEQKSAVEFVYERWQAAADDARTMRAECGGWG